MSDKRYEVYEVAVTRDNIKSILAFCKRYGVDFDVILKSVRDDPHLIRMDRKYRTRSGVGVTILTVAAPSTDFPVIGYDDTGRAMTWTSTGAFLVGEVSPNDLVLVED